MSLQPRTTAKVDAVSFYDAENVFWHVTERDSRLDPGARGDWCLVFSCDGAVRRIWDYPREWRDLAPDALLALSWRR